MSTDNRKIFDHEVDKLLKEAEEKIPDTELPDLPYLKEAPDVHDWYTFEHEIWDIGEEIRQLTVQNKKKFNEEQIGRIIGICLDKRVKRGRQSFVMLLGKKPDHGGLSRIGRAGDEIAVAEIVLKNVVFDVHLAPP